MDLSPDLDLRLPEYRREAFLRFYLHQVKHSGHPGGVYYLMPWLAEHYGWTGEQKLWFAYLNGNTQHPFTSLMLMQVCPRPGDSRSLEEMLRFFDSNWARLAFDTDRRHWKSKFPVAVRSYLEQVERHGSQEAMWLRAADGGWGGVWEQARALYGFGRLSAFSYAEYLRVFGYGEDCDDLYLRDIDGSRSHRAGLEIVTGTAPAEALDKRRSWSSGRIGSLTDAAAGLLADAQDRADAQGLPHRCDIGYFTLESALCTYKSWHKPNRRYPGVYHDMLYNRLRRAEQDWGSAVNHRGEKVTDLFWQARHECLPVWLRLESGPYDPGLGPDKQNHYLRTGQTVVMGNEDPQLWSSYDQAVADGAFGIRSDVRRLWL